ncbi:hypothetical protein [Helicobacter sp. 23-1045]
MKNKILGISMAASLAISGVFADDGENEIAKHFKENYSYNAQVGAQYSQGYSGNRSNFQSLYGYLGFEGVEFERLRFGLSAMGSVNLGSKSEFYDEFLGKNAILYQGFIGYTSEYFDVSAGREAVDLEWVGDYIEGARFAVKIPQGATKIEGYWFSRQGVADYNEILQFEDNVRGDSFIAGITNNSYEPLMVEAYFMSVGGTRTSEVPSYLGAWIGANLNLGNEFIASSTSIKYSFFHANPKDTLDTHFLDVAEHLEFAVADEHKLSATLGVMKVFNKSAESGGVVDFASIGNRRPLNKGSGYFYDTNALTAYFGVGYGFADYFDIEFLYGNISDIKGNIKSEETLKPLHNIDIVATGKYAGAEIGAKYRRVFSTQKVHNYFEAFVAYNF